MNAIEPQGYGFYQCDECGITVTADTSKLCSVCAARLCEMCEDPHYQLRHDGGEDEEWEQSNDD